MNNAGMTTTITIKLTVLAGWMRDEVTNTSVCAVEDADAGMAQQIARFAPVWPCPVTVPLCPDCLAACHAAGEPDFPHRQTTEGEPCGAADHHDPEPTMSPINRPAPYASFSVTQSTIDALVLVRDGLPGNDLRIYRTMLKPASLRVLEDAGYVVPSVRVNDRETVEITDAGQTVLKLAAHTFNRLATRSLRR